MRILTVDNKEDKAILETPSEPVSFQDDDVAQIVNDMKTALNGSETGVGLAANQIGVLKQIFVMDSNNNGFCKVFINPKILRRSPKLIEAEEGCLSRPDKTTLIKRPQSIRIQWHNEHGKEKVARLYGLEARIALHEMDHFKGILI